MHTSRFVRLVAAAAFCTAGFAAAAQQSDPNGPMPSSNGYHQQKPSSPAMAADQDFVKQASESNHAEINASELALKHSKNDDVKAFAKQMINDHTKLEADMMPLAKKLGVKTPQPLNATHKVEADRLSSMHGDKFDAEYITAMSTDHHKALGLMRNTEANATNPDVKAAAMSADPIVKQHMDMADQMAQKMNITLPPSPPIPDMPTM